MKDNEIFSNDIEDWAFCYNIHTERWEGFPKKKMREYNNGELKDGEFLQHRNINTIHCYIRNPEHRGFMQRHTNAHLKKR